MALISFISDSHLFENRIFRLDVFGTAVRTTYQTQNHVTFQALALSRVGSTVAPRTIIPVGPSRQGALELFIFITSLFHRERVTRSTSATQLRSDRLHAPPEPARRVS